MKLDNIDPMLVTQFRSEIMKGLKNKSVNNCIDFLRSMFNLGKNWGLVKDNPCKDIKSLKIPAKEFNWWEEWCDIERFLYAIENEPWTRRATKSHNRDPYAAAYRLALECGLRLGEIVGLSKQDIDFDDCSIRIHRQWITSKNEKEKASHYGPPKHNKIRTVGFQPDPPLRGMLMEAVERSSDPEIIFVTRTGHRVRSNKLSGTHFKKWVRRLELPDITFHDLRHTFSSWYMIREDNIWELMELLGHVNVKTTMRYAHLSRKLKRAPGLVAPTGREKVSLQNHSSFEA